MINSKIRNLWDGWMRPLGRGMARSGVSPDAITIGGVVVQAVAAVAILRGALVAAGLISIVAALADVFDGAVAKAIGRTSRFGALLDSTTDRLSDALFFLPIAWLYGVDPDIAGHASHLVAAGALVALVASFLVSYVKARAESLGYECNVGIAERGERVGLIIIGLILNLVPEMVALIAAVSLVTVVQRMGHVRRQANAA